MLLGLLGFMELVFLKADICVLGGSGEQSARVHEVTNKFWNFDRAPAYLLETDPTKREIVLKDGGNEKVLTASQTSVRGKHPQRLRMDEVDEMAISIYDAAMGQTMRDKGLRTHIVCSSTHQHPDGTMTEVLKRSRLNGWPVFEWCYKEALGFWLSQDEIDEKKTVVPAAMWASEYELQEPSFEDLAIQRDKVEACFNTQEQAEELGVIYEIEPPDTIGGRYVIGGDWAKENHFSVTIVLRYDCYPARVVAYRRDRRKPWPQMIEPYNDLAKRYSANTADSAGHDATGIGGVISDYLTVEATGHQWQGKDRSSAFSDCVVAIEHDKIRAPRLSYFYNSIKLCRNRDIYYHGGHPPDPFIALAVAWWHATRSMGTVVDIKSLQGRTIPKASTMGARIK